MAGCKNEQIRPSIPLDSIENEHSMNERIVHTTERRLRLVIHATFAVLVSVIASFVFTSITVAQAESTDDQFSDHEVAEIVVTVSPLTAIDASDPDSCSGAFVTHYLPHFTTSADGIIRMFQANGAGIASGDLDGDDDLDLVLGSMHGPEALFWNEGKLAFRKETFGDGDTRAVSVVDTDGDGLLDIILTKASGSIRYWHNLGDGEFVNQILPGVARLSSVLNWADMDSDGDLDLVTGSYDAGLLTDRGNSFLLGGGGGIVNYENRDGRFVPSVLETEAQAMAIALQDLNRDGIRDILVANDFAVQDYAWFQQEDGWFPAEPFSVTSHSTMSVDFGDVNNDGLLDIFTTDMMPYRHDTATMASWAPIMDGMDDEHPAGDPQHMTNTLQIAGDGTGSEPYYSEKAREWGVGSTGWSWSSKFGDFDQDGYLDLYIVNGMIEERMFSHLPDHELVEENQAYRNIRGLLFNPIPEWNLGSRYSGRGSVIADLDMDGDLDIAVNNLRGPVQIFENQLCSGESLQVQLHDPGEVNTYSIGAQVQLVTDMGILTRDVRSGSGYLSSDPARVHFGFPENTELYQLVVTWPDGAVSTWDSPKTRTFTTIERMRLDE